MRRSLYGTSWKNLSADATRCHFSSTNVHAGFQRELATAIMCTSGVSILAGAISEELPRVYPHFTTTFCTVNSFQGNLKSSKGHSNGGFGGKEMVTRRNWKVLKLAERSWRIQVLTLTKQQKNLIGKNTLTISYGNVGTTLRSARFYQKLRPRVHSMSTCTQKIWCKNSKIQPDSSSTSTVGGTKLTSKGSRVVHCSRGKWATGRTTEGKFKRSKVKKWPPWVISTRATCCQKTETKKDSLLGLLLPVTKRHCLLD